jgi:predicted Fe-S protein YdhL (DUF1289 family)
VSAPDQIAVTEEDDPDGGHVPTPCINVCKMDPQTGLCEGCYRTIDEIIQWSTASNDTKRAIWQEIRRREANGGEQ